MTAGSSAFLQVLIPTSKLKTHSLQPFLSISQALECTERVLLGLPLELFLAAVSVEKLNQLKTDLDLPHTGRYTCRLQDSIVRVGLTFPQRIAELHGPSSSSTKGSAK